MVRSTGMVFSVAFPIKMLLGLVALVIFAPVPCFAQNDNSSRNEQFSQSAIIVAAAEYLGTTAESMAEIIDKVFSRHGPPAAVIRGEEMSVAMIFGLRYGRGVLQFANGDEQPIYWRGPSAGIDTGANAAKSFALVYGVKQPEDLHKRFGGVDGSLFYVGGIAVNYLQRDNIVLAPMRVGVGLRIGASVGYLKFTPSKGWIPF